MKRYLLRIGLLVALVAIIASGCAPATPQTVEVTRVVAGTPVVEQVVVTATPEPTAVEPPFKVAVVMPSTIKDMAFSQSMYEGLLEVQKDMGGPDKMELAYSESMFNIPDAAAAIRDYAAQGYDLVIAHGSQYGSSVAQIAPDFPETSFAWGTAAETFQGEGINNVFAYETRAQDGGYVLGTIGALMSKSGVLGVCGPVEAGDGKLYSRGFKAGAEAAKPGVKVPIIWTGSFSDVSLMANCAQTHIQNGADVLTGSSQSVVGAVPVAKEHGAWWFGQQWEQTSMAPEVVVASQVYDWSGILNDMITSAKAGVMGGKGYVLTFANGGLRIVYNEAIDVPDEVKAAADAAIEGLKKGEVEIVID